MMKKNSYKTVFVLISFLMFASCGGGGGGGGADDKPLISSIEIMNAKSLYIAGVGHGDFDSDGRLMKVINNGAEDSIEEVIIKDENEKIISDKLKNDYGLWAESLIKINNEYLFINFISDAFLCRISDGKCIKLRDPEGEYNDEMKVSGNIMIAEDYDDLFFNGNGRMRKTNLRSLFTTKNLTCPSIIPDEVVGFVVDKTGNIIYKKNNIIGYSFYTKNGSNFVMSNCFSCWKGCDGFVYSQDFIDNEPIKPIKRITIINTPEEIHYETYSDNGFAVPFGIFEKAINISNYIYIIDSSGIKEVYNPGAAPRSIDLAGLIINEVYDVAQTEDFYYVAGIDSLSRYFIIKVTPGTTDYEYILGDGYKVDHMVASRWNGITFSAERMADGRKIVANIPVSGEMKILDMLNNKVLSLESLR